MASDEYPPYIPMPSLGHELGLMFGFLSLCIVVMGAYVALWRGELFSSFSSISLYKYKYLQTCLYLFIPKDIYTDTFDPSSA